MFYAVHKGFKPGVYNSWDNCKEQVTGFEGAVYKKFKKQSEAEEFVKNGRTKSINDKDKKVAKYYYSVHKGKSPGIYQTWNECKESVQGFKGAKFKKFENKLDAEKYLINGLIEEDEQEEKLEIDPKALKIYTDGSLIKKNGYIGCGYGIYVPKYNLKQGSILFDNKTNNRAELSAVIDAIQYASVKNENSITIYTDSSYVIHIFGKTGEKYQKKGYKNVKNKDLVEKAVSIKNIVRLVLVHVKAHSGDTESEAVRGNDIADKIANRYAVSDYIYQDHSWITREYNIGRYRCSLKDIPYQYLRNYIDKPGYKNLCKTNEHYRTECHIISSYLITIETSSDITYRY